MDECMIGEHNVRKTIKQFMNQLDVIWIASNAHGHRKILSGETNLSWYDDFTKFELSTNLRNTKAIVDSTLQYDETDDSLYKVGLKLPPSNFPRGQSPIHVDTLEDAMKKMRQLTNGGILIVTDSRYSDREALNNMGMYWKQYSKDDEENDFKEDESPYQHLMDGNVLVLLRFHLVNGFEWPNMICFEGKFGQVDYSACNFFMRCTANLIIIDQKKQV